MGIQAYIPLYLQDVWIYDSKLFLNLINLIPYTGVFKPQVKKSYFKYKTTYHPLRC